MAAGSASTQSARQHRGRTAYHTGLAAEGSVERHYRRQGWHLADSRWRGAGAEIDLIFERRGVYVFCEVKAAPTHDLAATRVGWTQLNRIIHASQAYLAQKCPGHCPEMRFDVALVDGQGIVQVIENVSMTA